MDGPKMADAAKILLRLLPTETLNRVLAELEPKDADRLRAMRAEATASYQPEETAQALGAFFDLSRIANQTAAVATQQSAAPKPPEAPTRVKADETAADPIQAMRGLDPTLLARAVGDEPAVVIATIVSRLEPRNAAELMKRLPAPVRRQIALRLNQGTTQSSVLVERLARAAIAKANKIADAPPEPNSEDRIKGLVAVLRRLERPDRIEILQAIEETDPQSAAIIRKQMFCFEDLVYVDDRPLQNLLTEFDARTLATALKGSPTSVSEKILRNISSRNRQMLTDEIGLLGNIPKATMDEAQEKIAELLRRYEEEGKVTIES